MSDLDKEKVIILVVTRKADTWKTISFVLIVLRNVMF